MHLLTRAGLPSIPHPAYKLGLGSNTGEPRLIVVDEAEHGPVPQRGADGVVGEGFAELLLGVPLYGVESLRLACRPHRGGHGGIHRLGALEGAGVAIAAFGECWAAGRVLDAVDCGSHSGAGTDDAAAASVFAGVNLCLNSLFEFIEHAKQLRVPRAPGGGLAHLVEYRTPWLTD